MFHLMLIFPIFLSFLKILSSRATSKKHRKCNKTFVLYVYAAFDNLLIWLLTEMLANHQVCIRFIKESFLKSFSTLQPPFKWHFW